MSRSGSNTPRRRRGDIHASGALERFLASDHLSSQAADRRLGELRTDATDPINVEQLIWGTTVNIEDSMSMFRDFVLNYSESTNELGERVVFYDGLLRHMKEYQNFNLNLDCTKLKNYEPTKRLYNQLIRYPQEIIPLLDHTLSEIFMEKFEDAVLPEDESIRVRPFNLGRSVNMRDLDPAGNFK